MAGDVFRQIVVYIVKIEYGILQLIFQDALESAWGRSAQGKFNFGNLTTGAKWKGDYVTGNDKNAKGEAIKQKFRSYNSMDEYAADKIQFLKRLYDFDENDDINKFTAKLTGSNRGKRRYAEATSYADSLTKVFNSFKKGGVIKAQAGTIMPDNTRVVKPTIQEKIQRTYSTQQQPQFVQDNRSDWERQQSQDKAQAIYNQYMQDKKTEEGLRNLNGFLTFTDYATIGLGAGSLLTKGLKWAGKKAIGQVSKNSIRTLNKSRLNNISDASVPIPSQADPLRVHSERIRNGGWNKLQNQGDIMGPGRLQIFNVTEQNQRAAAHKAIKNRFPHISDSEIEQFISNAQQGVSVDDGFRPQGIILMNTNDPMVRANYSRAVSHELDHSVHFPSQPAQGFDMEYLKRVAGDYYTRQNNTDLAARGSQIKDYFGLTNPNQPITEDMLRYAAKNYTKETGFDNNMSEFFSSIRDWKKAAEWLSKYASMAGFPIVITNNDDNNQ